MRIGSRNMTAANEHERDADMGYMLMYIKDLHRYIEAGGTLTYEASHNIRQAHTHIMNAWCDLPKEARKKK